MAAMCDPPQHVLSLRLAGLVERISRAVAAAVPRVRSTSTANGVGELAHGTIRTYRAPVCARVLESVQPVRIGGQYSDNSLNRLAAAVSALLSAPLIIAAGLPPFSAVVADILAAAVNLEEVARQRLSKRCMLAGGAAMVLALDGFDLCADHAGIAGLRSVLPAAVYGGLIGVQK